jgi:hypothetical protein
MTSAHPMSAIELTAIDRDVRQRMSVVNVIDDVVDMNVNKSQVRLAEDEELLADRDLMLKSMSPLLNSITAKYYNIISTLSSQYKNNIAPNTIFHRATCPSWSE